MANYLTDKQKKKIIADYVSCESYTEVARKHGKSETTIRRVVKGDPKATKAVAQKKEQNTLDMIAYMDSKRDKVQLFIDMCIDELMRPGRLESARVSEITTAMGTVIDKFTSAGQLSGQAKQGEELTLRIEGGDAAWAE